MKRLREMNLCVWRACEKILTRTKQSTRRNTCHRATLSITNPTWTVLGWKPGLRGVIEFVSDLAVGRDGVVGIATRYELDGPGIESQWGEGARFSAPVQTSCTMGTGSFPGVKRSGRGVDHPPLSSAEVKERVELYLYSPSRPSWPVLG
jgi:hypothetical protein